MGKVNSTQIGLAGRPRAWLRLTACSFAVLGLAACSVFPKLQAPTITSHSDAMDAATSSAMKRSGRAPAIEELPSAPVQSAAPAVPAPVSATSADIEALIEDAQIDVSLPPQPVPQFIDTVFGQMLHVPYFTGQGVAQRRDLIAFRSPPNMSKRELFAMAQMALSQYGLAVVIERNTVRIVQDDVLSGQAPTFIRTRAMPDTPASSRPVVQFFRLSSIDVGVLTQMLDGMYPNRGSVRFTPQPETNTLMIAGSPRDVAAAGALIDQLDRPLYAGGQVARVRPTFMSADQMADALTRVLTTEGYQVSSVAENRPRAITILPVSTAGLLLVFANDPVVFDRAMFWAKQVDTPAALGDREGVFVYNVQNTSAEDLGALVGDMQPANGPAVSTTPPEVAVRRTAGVRAGAQTNLTGAGPTSGGQYTIDTGGNRILFHGTASEYEHALTLLEELDTPPQQVLIELTIAEVTLTDETRFGVEWFLDQTISNGTLSASTLGAATRDVAGLGIKATHVFSRGTVEAALSAFASNHNLNILSTPRLVTRSGNEAQILIGTDVPIITSQRAADNQTGGSTDILQTVQYRQTGVILNVRPIVYGDDHVDIQLYQEVSSQEPNSNASISSPLILNRSVTTKLAIQDGMTAVIGGLIQDSYTRDQRGVPGLKDVPVLGTAFRRDAVSGGKVELVILVTPYVIHNTDEMSKIAGDYANTVNRSLRRRGPQVYTLYPWRVPFQMKRDHQLVPAHKAKPARADAAPPPPPKPVEAANDDALLPDEAQPEAAPLPDQTAAAPPLNVAPPS